MTDDMVGKIIYRPELKRIIRKERISIDHVTNEYIIFEDGKNMVDFDTPSIDHNKEVLDFFLLHFIGCDSNDFSLSSFVWEHLYKNLIALRNYL